MFKLLLVKVISTWITSIAMYLRIVALTILYSKDNLNP